LHLPRTRPGHADDGRVPAARHAGWAAKITAAGNAVAFILLMIWFIGVTEMVLRRSRPTIAYGHCAIRDFLANWFDRKQAPHLHPKPR
jgi:hypothetical protein